MNCYFVNFPEGVIGFSIPDPGIIFKARSIKTESETEVAYIALLSLLKFCELNPQLIRDGSFKIYGDSFLVINQVNNQMICTDEYLRKLKSLVYSYRLKFEFILTLISPEENLARK